MRNILMALTYATLATTAMAKTPLKDVPAVADGIMKFGIANEIRENCDSISPRLMRAYRYIQALKAYAESLGYSEQEIDAYVDNDVEKARLLGLANAYMQQRGVDPNVSQTYCALGLEEIKSGSEIGRLLKAR